MKQKVTHLFGGGLYFISSRTVSRNPLFYTSALCKRFIEKLDKYLGPICTIHHYVITNTEFQLLVRLKERTTLEQHYRSKHASGMDGEEIAVPPSSYIFSKAMSDLLVSTVKHFNYHHGRKGSMLASRFHREMVETEAGLDRIMARMHKMEIFFRKHRPWDRVPGVYALRKKRRELRKMKERCGWGYYKRERKKKQEEDMRCFKKLRISELRGYFKNLPPKHLSEVYYRFSTLTFLPKFPLRE